MTSHGVARRALTTARPRARGVVGGLWLVMAFGAWLGFRATSAAAGPSLAPEGAFLGAAVTGLAASWFATVRGYSRWLGLGVAGTLVAAAWLPVPILWSAAIAALGPAVTVAFIELSPGRRRRWGFAAATLAVAVVVLGTWVQVSAVRAEAATWHEAVTSGPAVAVAPDSPHLSIGDLWIGGTTGTDAPRAAYQIERPGLGHDVRVQLYDPGVDPCATPGPDHELRRLDPEVTLGVQGERIDIVCRRTATWSARVTDAEVWDGGVRQTGPLGELLAVPGDELVAVARSLHPVDPSWVTDRYAG